MKILLVYPQYPDTFWSFKYALKFISKKAAFPPLGLLTVAAMLPKTWEKKLVDLNVTKLKDKDLKWADYVFISAMIVQKNSVWEIIKRCKQHKVKIVAGGPLFLTEYKEFKDINYFILGEAEAIFPKFLADLKNNQAKRVYVTDVRPDIRKTPIPCWELIKMKNYASMAVQYSRGCPFNCEFCDIIIMNGRIPRTKEENQMLTELNVLYERGWRGPVFIVDDNFIGNKIHVKKLLSKIIKWSEKKKYPFTFFTEASLNLADDEELLQMMAKAGFNKVFLGIETPDEKSLTECNKFQNKNRNLVASVQKIQNYGMQVLGGFIVGFDSDPLSIFERQINFIQKSGIVTAMVGLLNAIPGTKLYSRLKKEGRLIKKSSGNNTDGTLNFIPKMDKETLIAGYKKIVKTIYSPKEYYERICTFLEQYKPPKIKGQLHFHALLAFLKSIWFLGIIGKAKKHYWKLITKSLFKYPRAFPMVVTLTIYGFHFRKIVQNYL